MADLRKIHRIIDEHEGPLTDLKTDELALAFVVRWVEFVDRNLGECAAHADLGIEPWIERGRSTG